MELGSRACSWISQSGLLIGFLRRRTQHLLDIELGPRYAEINLYRLILNNLPITGTVLGVRDSLGADLERMAGDIRIGSLHYLSCYLRTDVLPPERFADKNSNPVQPELAPDDSWDGLQALHKLHGRVVGAQPFVKPRKYGLISARPGEAAAVELAANMVRPAVRILVQVNNQAQFALNH